MTIRIYSEHGEEYVPESMTGGSAGLDIRTPEPIWLPHNMKTTVDTGLVIDTRDIDGPAWVLAAPRSSTGIKMAVSLQNTIGVIDPDYCGPDDQIKVFLKRDRCMAEVVDHIELNKGFSKRFKVDRMEAHRVKNDLFLNWCAEQGVNRYNYEAEMCYDSEQDTYYVFIGRHRDEPDFKPNPSDENLLYRPGDRFCQLIFLPFYSEAVEQIGKDQLQEWSRGGIGSTGVA